MMRVRATITIDIEAADFIEAAAHQRQCETLLGEVRRLYPPAVLEVRERRVARRERVVAVNPALPPRSTTGRLKTYVD